jgi:undecaprenyl phosphate-alpha-L-ara4N flippase subunit ArnE
VRLRKYSVSRIEEGSPTHHTVAGSGDPLRKLSLSTTRRAIYEAPIDVCPDLENAIPAPHCMTPELLVLLTVSVTCDVSGQTFFKLGATGIASSASRFRTPLLWVLAGLIVYVVEIFVWLRVLAIAPLTLAAPIASLNYIGVVLAGRYLFREHITPRQWAGSVLVMLGVMAVALTGG